MDAAVISALRRAGEVFGSPASATPELRWGRVLRELDGAVAPEYVEAIELIYEGYLLHYRRGRVLEYGGSETAEATLLAGDFHYALGLHIIARRGDVAAVSLLARLMAACAVFRSLGAAYADDDALWAYTMAALVALGRGCSAAFLLGPYEHAENAQASGEPNAVREEVLTVLPSLALPSIAPLVHELSEADLRMEPEWPVTAEGEQR